MRRYSAHASLLNTGDMSSDRIARNTTFLTLASVLQKILSFGYFAYLADALQTDGAGRYSFALSVTSLFIIFMDFGLGQLLTREGAKDESQLQKHISELWSIKLIMIVASAISCVAFAFAADAAFPTVDALDRSLILIGVLIISVDTVTFTLFSIFRALRQLQWEAISIVIYQCVIVAVGATAIVLKLPVQAYLLALLVGSIAQCVFLFIILIRKTPYRLHLQWAKAGLKKTLVIAAPFAVAGIIYRLTGSVDTMMLKVVDGNSATGYYTLAFKLTFALTVLPGAFATSYYPAMSRYVHDKSDQLTRVFENAMMYMALLAAPIAAGVFIIGGTIILVVWDQVWLPAASALSILMIGLPFVFFNYPVGNLLNAAGKQHVNTINMTIALLSNVALNAWLIPRYSFQGAAIASTASSVLLVAFGLPWVYRITHFSVARLAIQIGRVLLAALLMGFVVFWIQHTFPIPVIILISVAVYLGALLLVGAVRVADIRGLVAQVRRRVS
jgi:O-antigen/teichoic acid export membrane protein